jgi:hypothetical protein
MRQSQRRRCHHHTEQHTPHAAMVPIGARSRMCTMWADQNADG